MVDEKVAGLVLAGIGAIAFFGLDGVGRIQNAFATTDVIDDFGSGGGSPSGDTEVIDSPEQAEETSNVVPKQGNDGVTEKTERTSGKNDILVLTLPNSNKLTSDRLELPKSTQAVQVRKPEFVTKEEKSDPVAFNKRKFGIDEASLQKAQGKSSSRQTISEKKLIEAEKARNVFDSRSISNF